MKPTTDRRPLRLAAALLFGVAACGGPSLTGPREVAPEDLPEPDVRVTVDGATTFQTVLGFGGDFAPWHVADLDDGAQAELLERIVGEVGIEVFRMDLEPFEGVTSEDRWGENDNADPSVIDESRFDFCRLDGQACNDDWARLVPALRSAGARGLYWGLIQGPRWNGFDGSSDFSVDEMVENQVAAFRYFRDEHGILVDRFAPLSEPSGGGIDWPITADQARTVVQRLGQRLAEAGFPDVGMIVPDAVSPDASVEYARAILEDPAARQHVAAVGYHTYRSGPGGESPSGAWRSVRSDLRSLAESYGLPVRMTEFADIGGLMGRANHVHNELEFTMSRTYQPQTVVSIGNHGPGGTVKTEEGAIVYFLAGPGGELVEWGPTRFTGVAIGHYSRVVPPGSRRVDTRGEPADLRVQAFRAEGGSGLAVVLVNNGGARRVQLELEGDLQRQGDVEGFVTREGDASSYWSDVGGVLVSGSSIVSLAVPARSVTSLRIGS